MAFRHTLLVAAVIATLGASAHALELDPMVIPEINIGGRAIVTANYQDQELADGGSQSDSELDIADSSLLFGFSKYLFSDQDYGFAAFGIKLPEDDSDLEDDIYVHEVHVGIGGPRYELKLGRSRLTNTLVQFPTLRDDDLLEFTHVLNGSSNAEAEEFQIFGGLVQGSWWFTPAVRLTGALTARTETDDHGDRESSSNFNGGSLTLAYEIPETIKFDRGVRFAGISVDYQDLDDMVLGHGEAARNLSSDDMTAIIAALTYNLSNDPERFWVLDGQAIYNDGAEVASLHSEIERARAESTMVALALRYFHRPYLQTRWQAAAIVGWKDYRDFDDATAYTVTPSFVYRLGAGVDLLAQYQYRHNDTGLATATGVDDEHRIAVGISFAFDYTLNESVGERGSILNLEHDTLDLGPVGGGH